MLVHFKLTFIDSDMDYSFILQHFQIWIFFPVVFIDFFFNCMFLTSLSLPMGPLLYSIDLHKSFCSSTSTTLILLLWLWRTILQYCSVHFLCVWGGDWVFWWQVCLCANCMPVAYKCWKWVLEHLKLELHIVVSGHVGAGNWASRDLNNWAVSPAPLVYI